MFLLPYIFIICGWTVVVVLFSGSERAQWGLWVVGVSVSRTVVECLLCGPGPPTAAQLSRIRSRYQECLYQGGQPTRRQSIPARLRYSGLSLEQLLSYLLRVSVKFTRSFLVRSPDLISLSSLPQCSSSVSVAITSPAWDSLHRRRLTSTSASPAPFVCPH